MNLNQIFKEKRLSKFRDISMKSNGKFVIIDAGEKDNLYLIIINDSLKSKLWPNS